jgi:hypothetical protein
MGVDEGLTPIMQRWIVIGVVAMMLLLGGGGFSYRTYKQHRPHPVWVPLPINPELSDVRRDQIINELKEKLSKPELLIQVSRDVDLVKKWHLASDEEGARKIGERLSVKTGDADTPLGKVPAIHIRMEGNRKESAVTGGILMRLMDEVWKILGVNPPSKKDS